MYISLAPMDGITDGSYRNIVEKLFLHYGNKKNKLILTTEFMSAHGFVASPIGVAKHLLMLEYKFTPSIKKNNLINIAQIFGSDEEKLSFTAKRIYENLKQYNIIELNIGCPSPKICATGAGAAMLKNKNKTLNIIKKLSKLVNGNFSIKTRVGLNQKDKSEQFKFLIKAANYCKIITIHGRTFQQSHGGKVDWNFIYKLRKAIGNNTLIIGNGGIKSYEEVLNYKQILDGISIGQGAIGNPWVFLENIKIKSINKLEIISQHFNNHLKQYIRYEFIKKYIGMKNNIKQLKFLSKQNILIIPEKFNNQNIEDLISTFQIKDKNLSRPTKEFRKHLFVYLKGLPDNKKLKQNIIKINNRKDLITELQKIKR